MSTFKVLKDGDNLTLQRITRKGSRKHWIALVKGAGTGEFKLDLQFLSEEDLASKVVFEEIDGKNAAVESFRVKSDAIFQVGQKQQEGERREPARFFVIRPNGKMMDTDRESVFEEFDIPWDPDWKPRG